MLIVFKRWLIELNLMLMYAIVDIETTGGSAVRSRITEIAIILFDGYQIIKRFQTLINPGREIPEKIQQLTGINNRMTDDAPFFYELVDLIDHYTKGCVFVAHNVNFDYGFIKEAFARTGRKFQRKKLCTVRISRKMLPGKSSYSLGKLCKSEGIPLLERHRAMGDADATCLLFKKLLALDREGWIEQSLKRGTIESFLPPHCPVESYRKLPSGQGLYYFYNQKRKVVYVGKAKNIRQRVRSHFSGLTNTKGKYYFMKSIYDVKAKPMQSELLCSLLEAIEIKKHWPIYNKSMKRFSLNYGIFNYQDQKGYERLSYAKCGKFDRPLKAFKQLEEVKDCLKQMCLTFDLCPRLIDLQPMGSGKCNHLEITECKGACCNKETADSYNPRFKEAVSTFLVPNSTYILRDIHANRKLQSIVLVEQGRVKGFADEVSIDEPLTDRESIHQKLHAVYDDQDLAWVVEQHQKKAKQTDIIYLT